MYENLIHVVFANVPKVQFKSIMIEIHLQKMVNETLKRIELGATSLPHLFKNLQSSHSPASVETFLFVPLKLPKLRNQKYLFLPY